jgi:hypothetical protein
VLESARIMRCVARVLALFLVPVGAGCSAPSFPVGPTPTASVSLAGLILEGEPGSGDGVILQRSRATGGQTLHLAPGERRRWIFSTGAVEARHVFAVRYSNSRGGDREVLMLDVDGMRIGSLQVRDTGDETEGWNTFADDAAGALTLRPGSHALTIESSGGDGCVEIDFVIVSPQFQ